MKCLPLVFPSSSLSSLVFLSRLSSLVSLLVASVTLISHLSSLVSRLSSLFSFLALLALLTLLFLPPTRQCNESLFHLALGLSRFLIRSPALTPSLSRVRVSR